jgi:hypothetical protein
MGIRGNRVEKKQRKLIVVDAEHAHHRYRRNGTVDNDEEER